MKDNIEPTKQEKERALKLKKLKPFYDKRITVAKEGREAFSKKDYRNAVIRYHEYLGLYAEYHNVDSIFKLTPHMFDQTEQVREIFLISHVYFDLAQVNQMTPRLSENFRKSLLQFVKFTVNQPYQVLNAEMLRKYIKKSKVQSLPGREELQKAYSDIHVQSKGCYIATYLMPTDQQALSNLRYFKSILLRNWFGRVFVTYYYRHSEHFVFLCSRNLFLKYLSRFALKPSLKTLSLLIGGFKQC